MVARLLRPGDGQAVLLGQRIHVGAGRKVVGVLRTALQHNDQPLRPLRLPGRQEQLEVARTGATAMGAVQMLCAPGYGRRARRRGDTIEQQPGGQR